MDGMLFSSFEIFESQNDEMRFELIRCVLAWHFDTQRELKVMNEY